MRVWRGHGIDTVHIRRLLRNMSALSFISSAGAHLWAELAGYLLFVLPPPLHHWCAAMLELAKLEVFKSRCFTCVECNFPVDMLKKRKGAKVLCFLWGKLPLVWTSLEFIQCFPFLDWFLIWEVGEGNGDQKILLLCFHICWPAETLQEMGGKTTGYSSCFSSS